MRQLMELSHRHEQIINWLILNPDRPLQDCAQHFGYSQPWVSQIVHSDMFQAAYRKRAAEVGQLAVHTIAAELGGLTALAIEKSREKILNNQASERFLGQVLDTTLEALGYGSGAVKNPGIINVQVNAQVIQQSRERAAELRRGQTEAKVVEITQVSTTVPSNGHSNGNGHAAELSVEEMLQKLTQ